MSGLLYFQSNMLQEVQGDKVMVGQEETLTHEFGVHELQLQNGTTIY